MNYLSSKQAADKWGISERRVRYLCQNNKIENAVQIGKSWMIPTSSKKPIDGRLKGNKNINTDEYHFPILIHTFDILQKESLNHNSQQLLKAQELYIQGHYVESYRICINLLSKTLPYYVAVGAYATLAYNCIHIGDYDHLQSNLNSIDKYCFLDRTHSADYRMIKACISFHTDWNSKQVFDVNTNELSSLSINFYLYMTLLTNVIKYKSYTSNDLIIYELFSRQLDVEGIDITSITVHSLLSIVYERINDSNKALEHFEKAYLLAKKHNCLNYIAKYYTVLTSTIKNYFKKENKVDYLTIVDYANRNYKTWQSTNINNRNDNLFKDIGFNGIEYITLSFNGMPDEKIAKIQNISCRELNKRVLNLYETLNVKNRSELHELVSKRLQLYS